MLNGAQTKRPHRGLVVSPALVAGTPGARLRLMCRCMAPRGANGGGGTFASTLVGKGRSLHEVGTLLGHSQISMTMRYAHLAPARLIEAANEALPDM